MYVVQSTSLIEPLTAEYRGSTSMRGARGALGFLVRSVLRDVRLGRVPEESVGVVETFMSLGRIVPAMMAVDARRRGAQCVGMVARCEMVAQLDGCACGLRRRPQAAGERRWGVDDSIKASVESREGW